MKYFISLLILLCLIFGSDIQRHISMSIVFSKWFNVLANWAFQGFGCASNDLQHSDIATIKFALGQKQIQFESGPMQFW